MSNSFKEGFEFDGLVLRLEQLLPNRPVPDSVKKSNRYQAIVAAIREVGVIEPLSVYPQEGGKYLILDGHVRVEALRELGIEETRCLISKDDEGYTYNHKVNAVSPIQANRMILKALDAGLSEERIASALNLKVHTVRSNRNVMEHICPEAVELLKDKMVTTQTLRALKKVKPLRQMEMADAMIAADNYSATYARVLLVGTPKEQLVDPETPKKLPGVKPEDLARLEHEMRVLEKDFLLVEETYSKNNYGLMIARGYLKKLLDNARVVRFLGQKFRDLLPELQRIVESKALEA